MALALVLGAACGEEDSEPGAGSGGASGMAGASGAGGAGTQGGGETTCGLFTCEAGQHCNNGVCVNGCLTAANCLQGQACEDIDPDTQIGTCRDMPGAATKDCEAFCEKAVACMDPEAAMCNQICTALSSECVSCVVDSNCGTGCEDLCEI